jgi:hypothetical protein
MEENFQNNIDDIFRDSLSHYKNEAPAHVWNAIEHELDEYKLEIDHSRSAQKRSIRICSVVMLIALIGLSSGLQDTGRPAMNPKTTLAVSSRLLTPINLMTRNRKIIPGLVNNMNRDVTEHINATFQPVSGAALNTIVLTPMTEMSFSKPGSDVKPAENAIARLHTQRFGSRFSVTPYFSQEFAGYNFSDNDIMGANGKEIEKRERNVFSISTGFYLNFKLNHHWKLQSGISYSWSRSNIDSGRSYAVKNEEGTVQFKLNTISGYGYLDPTSAARPSVGDSVLTTNTYSELHYLTVPLILSYNMSFKRFSLLIGGGVTFNLLTSATIQTNAFAPGNANPGKLYTIYVKGLKNINYGIIIKADLEYHVNSRIGIDLIPTFKNALTPINLKTAVSAYPYNFGIGLGFTYHF